MSPETSNAASDVRDIFDAMGVVSRRPGAYVELAEIGSNGLMRWRLEDRERGNELTVEFVPDEQLPQHKGAVEA